MEGKRLAVVDVKKCNPKKCQKECMSFCPRVRSGDETVVVDEKRAYIDESTCIGCGICVKKCPKHAIKIVNLASEPEKKVHQFGRNGFRLYGLPIPKPGSVVGLLGLNGSGKSTAIKILSGHIKPNLGILDREVEWNEVFEMFRGSELHTYLKNLAEKKVRVIMKPQEVDRIPVVYGEKKVADVLRDERNDIESALEMLELKHVIDRKLKELSGGELQRVAIASCLLREADFYLFDEPSSFLDVKQRLNVAKAIRYLVEKENKSVMVVEHDLATLDFMADYIHIFYGVPQVYGVVSNIYSVRRGINNYLEGYIREENVRFRDEPLSFEPTATIESEGNVVIEYTRLEKTLGSFKLTVEKGKLHEKNIVAVMGANALGKTTFAKMLAGILEPDEGHINAHVKISYKPQYIESVNNDQTVKDALISISTAALSSTFKKKVLQPLEIADLMDRKLKELSGGELQRVAIASCLLREADFYLFDEPSAYLDVEQRVKFAKIIKNFVEETGKGCLVIDHDLLLLTYLASRALVFSGVPGKQGKASANLPLEAGMNMFLKEVDVTFRKDEETFRPRANKPNSQKDVEQKSKGKYFIM